jgi:peptidoglycan/xylan/chitin deacetylase (PgdA/CDA1 family)
MKKKLKIKSLPQFIKITFMSIIILILLLFAMLTLINHFSSALNIKKEASQNSSTANESSEITSDTKKADPPIQKEASKREETIDPLADIKIRLKTGDTDGINVAFLTFDDGPNQNTDEVLDILKAYDVKATFFTVLKDNDVAKACYNRIVNEGHTLGNHTSSHCYDLYNTPDAFYTDVENLDNFQREITGQSETSHIFRFPGGSLNSNETCIQGILDRGYNYADWNVAAGDGNCNPPPRDIVFENIVNECHNHDVSVILCHAELKPETLAALPRVIETLKAEGYIFLPMDKDYIYPRHLEI